ncbi:MAG TPA: glutamine-hydrolyzing GMP synthase [Streptosporangiaceae bacterium]|nr:glutamine-hydrolyzing GMP synthase [Streptosporangiaceae bacterium]
MSGGVDSAVAAALVQRAIGDRLTCVFVDHGLLRKGEAEQVETDFVAATGVRLKVATEADAFLTALAGVSDPEQKRKIIGREFIRAFERAAREINAEAGQHGEACEFLVQGTLYPDVVESGVPMLGICYGFQVMVDGLGGTVERTPAGEYGATDLTAEGGGALLATPPGFTVTARTQATPVAAVENPDRALFGVQFHPEVMHTEYGTAFLARFLELAGCRPSWTMLNIVEDQVAAVREQVGGGRAICGLSGGVDSAVAAALVQRAIGDRLTCVFVDHGLLRKGEAEQVETDFVAATGVRLKVATEADAFLTALAGVSDPEQKRKIIGREFIRAFERAAREITAEAGEHGEACEFLVQGTLYPDVVESGGGTGAANIKSHHNVGGLPDDLKFRLVEPLRALFKDEVRRVGSELGLPQAIVRRQPFPGPGLAIRIVGEVTADRLAVLREADAIVREEMSAAGLDALVWQCPVVLLADVRSVGVQGDGRSYGHPLVLRPVTSEDAMTADWARLPADVLARISTRVTNEVPEINRVVLDVTSKPPATIEWE